MISKERLAKHFSEMEKISTPNEKPGIFRLAFSDSDWQGREYLMSLMKDAGLSIRIDAFGNVIARREGRNPSLPAIMFGSHGDSVPAGGNYDGVLGVLASIEVMKSLDEENFQNEHPLEAVIFMCEESSRFGMAELGSRVMRGELSTDDLHSLKGKDGKSLYEVLKSRNLSPDNISEAVYNEPLKAFLEVHIEQGKVLEYEKTQIGVVTGIAAPTRLRVFLHGKADHSGATPMGMRSDALCASAEITLLVEKLASEQQNPPAVGTVGILNITPGVMNVIPGEAEMGIDIRSIDKDAKAKIVETLKKGIDIVCKKRDIEYEIKVISDETPVPLSASVVDYLSSICEDEGVSYKRMPSGAGHDTMFWAPYAPAGMLFIPCKDGISHNAAEHAEMDDIFCVTKLLEKAVKKLSQENFNI